MDLDLQTVMLFELIGQLCGKPLSDCVDDCGGVPLLLGVYPKLPQVVVMLE